MSFVPKTAFVPAAGLGKRMRPLTDRMPKPMVHLRGRPLIDHVLDRISDAGITTAVVNVHYLPNVIETHLASRARPKILISDERDQLLDTGGGVVRALAKIGPEPFLIHNSDSVWIETAGSNLARLFAAWDPDRMDSLMLVTTPQTSIGYDGRGDFEMDAAGRLSRRKPNSDARYVFTGVSIMHPRLLDASPPGPFSLNAPWDLAIAQGRLHGVRMAGTWMHVGTPQTLAEAEAKLDAQMAG
jgi:MurNAc alpha-1-phosphate uridylyltransferase